MQKSTVKYFQNYREMKSMAAFKMKNKEKDLLKVTQMLSFLLGKSCYISMLDGKKNERLNFTSYK